MQGAAAYLSHMYTQGETCDLTGKPRLAEVRYFCGEGSNADVTNIMEEPSCEYVIHVQTRLLCSHPNFKPQVRYCRSYCLACVRERIVAGPCFLAPTTPVCQCCHAR